MTLPGMWHFTNTSSLFLRLPSASLKSLEFNNDWKTSYINFSKSNAWKFGKGPDVSVVLFWGRNWKTQGKPTFMAWWPHSTSLANSGTPYIWDFTLCQNLAVLKLIGDWWCSKLVLRNFHIHINHVSCREMPVTVNLVWSMKWGSVNWSVETIPVWLMKFISILIYRRLENIHHDFSFVNIANY